MNLTEMLAIVRRDLRDEDDTAYRWTDAELEGHILHAVRDFSVACPREMKVFLETTPGIRELDISTLTDRITVDAVEFPINLLPRRYSRFEIYRNIITLSGDVVPDGSDAAVYYGALHVLGAETSSLPPWQENTVAVGAAGYAATAWAVYGVNRANTGGSQTVTEMNNWGKERLETFHRELKRLSRKNRVRARALYPVGEPPPGASPATGH